MPVQPLVLVRRWMIVRGPPTVGRWWLARRWMIMRGPPSVRWSLLALRRR
ncbi:hypothetical protein [Micromonospora sp. NPDC023888]